MVAGFANGTAESEGIWTSVGGDVTVLGSVHQRRSEDVQDNTTGQMSEQRNIVCRMPLSASVTYGDQIVIENFHAVVNGIYEIDALEFTKTHIRAECRRTMR
jgi:hypothetical protein